MVCASDAVAERSVFFSSAFCASRSVWIGLYSFEIRYDYFTGLSPPFFIFSSSSFNFLIFSFFFFFNVQNSATSLSESCPFLFIITPHALDRSVVFC